jgi:hypothetical protein
MGVATGGAGGSFVNPVFGVNIAYAPNTVLVPTDGIITITYPGSPVPPVPCFLNTCSILTDKGYIGISNIRKGDNVISAFTHLPTTVLHCGYRSVNLDVVEKINHPMVIQANHFKHNIPSKDVVLSGNHRIICPGFSPTTHLGIQVHKLHDFKILNTEEVLVLTNLPDVRYYHIDVEGGKNAVFCDGLPVETLEAGEWDEYTMTEN